MCSVEMEAAARTVTRGFILNKRLPFVCVCVCECVCVCVCACVCLCMRMRVRIYKPRVHRHCVQRVPINVADNTENQQIKIPVVQIWKWENNLVNKQRKITKPRFTDTAFEDKESTRNLCVCVCVCVCFKGLFS